MIDLEFVIEGRAVAKARPRVQRNGHTYTPQRTREWESWVALQLNQLLNRHGIEGCPLSGNIAISITFCVAGYSGDIDNLCKSMLDGANGVLFLDDRQVVELHARIVQVKRSAQKVILKLQEITRVEQSI